jgi:glycosyltransferase involved in cell wall biosynthesis
MTKVLLIEDKRSSYSMKRYVAHLKGIKKFDFSVLAISASLSLFATPFIKYIVLPFKVFFAKQAIILIPAERYAYLVWFWRGEKSIVVCHDLHELMNKSAPFYLKCFYKLLLSGLKTADRIITVSQHTKSDLVRFYGSSISEEKISVLYNGLESIWFENESRLITNQYSDLPKKRYVLMVGSAAWYKNLNRAIESIIISGLCFVKVGKLSKYQIERLNASGIEYYHFDGIKDEELKFLYQNAIVYFHPSIHEGFGWPLVEAMACGCKIVTAKNSSITELTHVVDILYTDPKDVDSMLESINLALASDIDTELSKKSADKFKLVNFQKEFQRIILD